MKILLVAEESAGVQLLRKLAERDHNEILVLTSPPDLSGKRATVWRAAENLGLAPLSARLVRDSEFAERIRSEKVDILLNVHSLFIIREEVLEAPRLGCFNLHPGPLPQYAGLNCPSWAIYRGEKQYGVTVHRMEPRIDTGPIAYQIVFDIDQQDTGLSVTAKCITLGVPLMLRLVETASADPNAIPRVPQDPSQREYFGREVPQNGRLNWNCSARRVLDFLRASDYFPFPSPWGHPRTNRGNLEIGIVKACLTGKPSDGPPGIVGLPEGGAVAVACADEWLLVNRIQVGRNYTSPAEVLKPGDRLSNES